MSERGALLGEYTDGSMTELLCEMSYSELLDLLGQLTRFYPDHELTPWIEQELEIREEQMKWAIEEMYRYEREHD